MHVQHLFNAAKHSLVLYIFLSSGPSKPIDVGFVLARVEDTEATGSSSVLEAAVSDGDGENVRML